MSLFNQLQGRRTYCLPIRAMRHFIILFSLFILTACGGGGGGNTAPASITPSSSNSNFPSSPDMEWYYSNSSIKTYATTTQVNGKTAQVLNYPTGTKEYFQITENEIALAGLYTPSIEINGVGTFQVDFKFNKPLKLLGNSISTTQNLSTTGSANIQPTYGNKTISVQGSSTIVGVEQISVPYGTFEAIHVKFDLTMSASIDGYYFSIPWQAELWFAEDIGIVRRSEYGQTINLTQFTDGSDSGSSLATKPLTILVPDNGVALTKFPTVSKLEHTVDILDSYGQSDIYWRATTSADWLTITPSGTTGEQLVISADTTGLIADTLYEADIVVIPDNKSINSSETIKVGLWIGSTDPEPQALISGSFSNVATDPVRPYLYVSDGSTKTNSIRIYHTYTQTYIGSLNPGTNYLFGHMEVSEDGRFLFAGIDSNKIAVFDLETRELLKTWQGSDDMADSFTLAKPSGFQLLLNNSGIFYRASDGVAYARVNDFQDLYSNDITIDASLYGNRFCYIDHGLSPYSLGCYKLDFNSNRNGVSVESIGHVAHGTGSNGRDVALNKDGSTAYVASGAPYSFSIIDIDSMTVTGSLPADAYPNGVQVGPSDEVHGIIDSNYSPYDLWVYEADGTERLKADASGGHNPLLPRALAVSGDGYLSIVSDGSQVILMSSY